MKLQFAEVKQYKKWFYFVLIATFFIKLALSLIIPVTGDEAYYAIWGKYLALGYYDHTPFIGWLLYPFVSISMLPIVVRLPTVLMTTIIGVGLYFTLRDWDEKKAVLTSIIFLISPLSLCAVIITTDTPVILFSFLSGVSVFFAIKHQDNLWLYTLGGLFLGLAFFSKYFAVLLALVYAVFLLGVAPNKKRIYGLMLIFLGVLPFGLENLYWNYTHAWANILFNVYNRNVTEHFSISKVVTYLLCLIYITTPPLVYYLLKYRNKLSFTRNACQISYLSYLIIVPLGFFLLLSTFKEIGLHWPLSFITFVYLWAGITLNSDELLKTLKFMLWFTGVHLLVIFLILVLPISSLQKLPISQHNYVKLVYFFKHKEIRDRLKNFDKDYIFASLNYIQADMMYFDSGIYSPTFGIGSVHGRQDDLITDFKKYTHQNFLIFYTRLPRAEEYKPYFAQAEIHSFQLEGATFYYVLAKDFNYPAYRNTILRHINNTYWQVPAYIPHKPSFYCEKYFYQEGCG